MIDQWEEDAQLRHQQWWENFNRKAGEAEYKIAKVRQELDDFLEWWEPYSNGVRKKNFSDTLSISMEASSIQSRISSFEIKILGLESDKRRYERDAQAAYKQYAKIRIQAEKYGCDREPKKPKKVSGPGWALSVAERDERDAEYTKRRNQYSREMGEYDYFFIKQEEYSRKASSACSRYESYQEQVTLTNRRIIQEKNEFNQVRHKLELMHDKNVRIHEENERVFKRESNNSQNKINQLNEEIDDLNSSWNTRANEMKKSQVKLYTDRAYQFLCTAEYDRVIEDCNRAMNIMKNDLLALCYKGDALFAKENYKLALEYYKRCLQISPNDSLIFYRRGITYKAKNNYAKARKDFEKSLKIDPNYSLAKRELGEVTTKIEQIVDELVLTARAASKENNFDLAVSKYSQAIVWLPKRSGLYVARGEAYEANQNYDFAFQDYQEASSSFKISAMTNSLLKQADDAKDSKQYNDALWYLNKTLEWHPQRADLYIARGEVHEANESYDSAFADYQKANDSSKIYSMANSLFAQGCNAKKNKSYHGALWCFKKVLEWYPASIACYTAMGEIQEEMGNLSSAYVNYNAGKNVEKRDLVAKEIINKNLPGFQKSINAEYEIFKSIYDSWASVKTNIKVKWEDC